MRYLLPLLVVVVVVSGVFYWLEEAHSTCKIPIGYRIGVIDNGFDITDKEARNAISDAESLWEDATGRNLFTYDEEAELTVNFIFDDRQEFSNEAHELREILDTKEELSESIKEQYENMVSRYDTLKSSYGEKLAAYENDLAVHNGEVAHWNNEGGAPPEVYERLNESQRQLNEESQELARLARQLNNLVTQINALGTQGNRVVEDYNEDVQEYNDRFNHAHEFTQGDYQGDSINIYQFDDGTELRIVLAHELGHALSLDHVNDAQSVMYYLMEGQLENLVLSAFDLSEYERVCGE